MSPGFARTFNPDTVAKTLSPMANAHAEGVDPNHAEYKTVMMPKKRKALSVLFIKYYVFSIKCLGLNRWCYSTAAALPAVELLAHGFSRFWCARLGPMIGLALQRVG